MRIRIIGFLLFVSIASFSQKNDFQVLSYEIILGKNLLTNSEIKGIQYIFPDRIHETFIDTISNYLTVQLRGLRKEKWLNNKGIILQYDLSNKKLLWSKKIAYRISSLQQFTNTMIFTFALKNYYLDLNTGVELWELKNNIFYVDPIGNIGFAYRLKSSAGNSNELVGINLESGNPIWKRKLNREYGWNDLFYTNDSTMIVVAAGLHSININSGKGWDYNTITGKKDYTGTAIANAAGVATGLLTGTFVIATGHNLVRDLVSNVLLDSSYIYLASKEQLAKIDKQTGEIVWKNPFPKDFSSKSFIFINDSLVYMINYGFAFMGNRQLNFGKPFIAAYDRLTGNQKYFSFLDVKDEPILDFQVLNNEIFLVFKNRIAKYSKETGVLIIERDFPDDSFGELEYFVGNQVFVKSDNDDLISLHQSDTNKVFVFTNQGKTLSVDKQLNISKTIEYEDLSIYSLSLKDYKFLVKSNKTIIIDSKGKRVAEMDISSNAFLIGETLYDIQNDSLLAIDLKEIVNN